VKQSNEINRQPVPIKFTSDCCLFFSSLGQIASAPNYHLGYGLEIVTNKNGKRTLVTVGWTRHKCYYCFRFSSINFANRFGNSQPWSICVYDYAL